LSSQVRRKKGFPNLPSRKGRNPNVVGKGSSRGNDLRG